MKPKYCNDTYMDQTVGINKKNDTWKIQSFCLIGPYIPLINTYGIHLICCYFSGIYFTTLQEDVEFGIAMCKFCINRFTGTLLQTSFLSFSANYYSWTITFEHLSMGCHLIVMAKLISIFHYLEAWSTTTRSSSVVGWHIQNVTKSLHCHNIY